MTVSSMPPQWSSSTLSDVTTIIRGVTYKKAQASNQPFTGSLAILRANNIQGGNVIAKDLVYVPSDFVKPHQRLLKGDIVVAMSSGSKAVVGKTARIKENFDGSFGAFCGVLRPVSKVIPTYLAWFTHSLEYRNRISSLSAGANINNLKPSHFDEIQIPLAPLAEQKVIADKLDTLLSQVENTKARLERIPKILKRFRQSVLAAAVSGRLTGGTFVNLGTLKNVADIVSGVAFKKAQYSNSGSKLLQIANVGYGDTKWDSVSYIPSSLADDFSTYSLAKGDIVMALNRPITNDTLKVAAVSVDDLPATLYQRVARIRSKPELLNSRYLFLLMQGPDFRKKVELNLKGSDQPYLNTSSLGTFEIYAPELEKQTEIVRRVDQLLAHADRIEQQVNNALTRVNNLTQSILAKAFRGELTEQWRKDNPELISGENSAEALLARIKSERAAVAKPKRRKTKA